MKKWSPLVLILLCILTLAGCAKTKDFKIAGAQRILLMSGSSGETVEITDMDTVRQITDNMTSLTFERGLSSKTTTGWRYNLRWYDDQDREAENITIMRDNTIEYQDYFWIASNGSINMSLLDDLINENQGGEQNG